MTAASLHKMAQFWGGLVKRKISNKLIAVCASFFVISVVLVCIGNYCFTVHQLRNAYLIYNKRMLHIICENYQNYIDQISSQSLAIWHDENLITSLASGDYTYEIENKLRLLSPSRLAALGIRHIEYYAPKSGKVFLVNRYTVKTDFRDYRGEKWYQQVVASRDFKYIEPLCGLSKPAASAGKGDFVIFHRIIINIEDQEPLLAIRFHVDMSIIRKYLTLARVKKGEMLFIFDRTGTVFYANSLSGDKAAIAKNIAGYLAKRDPAGNKTFFQFNKVKYIEVTNQSSGGWQIVKIAPLSLIDSEMNQIFTFAVVAVICLIVTATLAIIVIVKNMTSGITRLTKYMDDFAAGDFHVQIPGATTDEIGLLTERFNFMARKVNDLINEEYRLKLNEKNAVLKALETQVNPHFLYNTLQAISGKALLNKQEDISRMIGILASTFRYCLSKERMVPLFEELENIRKYVELCKIRFGGRLEVEYGIDETMLDFMVPRMLLQELLENTVKHAVETTRQRIVATIDVSVANETVQICVSDNGPGISREKLQEIIGNTQADEDGGPSGPDEDKKGIGLANLSGRLRLIYGKKVSLKINSEMGHGFEVGITLPKLNQETGREARRGKGGDGDVHGPCGG